MRSIAPTRRSLRLTTGLLAALALTPLTVSHHQDPAPPQDPDQAQPAGPTVGQPAPTGRLNDQEGHAVTIGGKSDKWTVLAFYPKAATPG